MTSPKTLARLAGVMYVIGSAGLVFDMLVQSRIVEPDNAAAAADFIRASETLLRVAFAVALVSIAAWLVAVLALYQLLKLGNELVALAMVILVALAVSVECVNLVNQYTALTVATNPDYTLAFGKPGSDALVMLVADMRHAGSVVIEMFWGLWLLPLGRLVIRSGYFPKALGVLLIVAGLSLGANLFLFVLAPDLARSASFLVVGDLGEIPFVLWLLVKGAGAPTSRVPIG